MILAEYSKDFIGPKEPWFYIEFQQAHNNSNYLFNFRYDTEAAECVCADRATWPKPSTGFRSIPEDPLADFIKEYHQWKEQGGG